MNEIKPILTPSNVYTQRDAYELVYLYLEGESSQRVDLKPLFQNFTFVEDIFKCAMSGSVLIKDAVNLFNTFPILGYEKVKVSFKTPGINSKNIEHEFDVVSVTDKVRGNNERSDVYRINFVSNSATKDKTTKISKSVKGKISDIAKKIYSKYIGGELDVQETRDEQKYVIPRWSPFKTLEWLAKRAVPAKRSKETNYLFFESSDGHKFITLSELASAKPVTTYFNIPNDVDADGENRGKDLIREFTITKDNLVINTNQKLQEQMKGAYSSTLFVHDITTKQWARYVYNYNDDDGKVRYVTDNKLTKNKDKYASSPDSAIHLTTKQTGLMGKDYPEVQNQKDWLQRAISTDVLLESIKVKINVSGNSILRAGSVVEYYTPKAASLEEKDQGEWFDEYTSGRYIITTLRHSITPEGYTNTLLMSKNSYEQAVPDQVTFLETGAGKNTGKGGFLNRS